MAYKEDLGRVKGDKGDTGDTYVPTITNNDDGTITITFTNDNDNSVVEFPNLVLPYYVPYVDNSTKQIKFRLNTSEPAPTVGSINLSDLKGEDGHIAIEIINQLPSLNNAQRDTIYIKVEDTDNDNIDSKVTAYIVYEDTQGNKRWETIEQFIDLNNYYDKTAVDGIVTDIEADINARLECILAQQQNINSILTNGINLEDEEMTSSNPIIHVLSSEQVDDLRDEISAQLKEYIKDEDINLVLEENDGILSIVIQRVDD